jgi:hypothetical protein
MNGHAQQLYCVTAVSRWDGKLYHSWHSNRADAVKSAKEQRGRRVWKRVSVALDCIKPA